MTFIWPSMLLLLLLVPAAVALYFALLRRRKKLALRYASLMIMREAAGAGRPWRRHIPPLLFLVALTLMIIAVARPSAVMMLPSQYDTVVLAIDVSASMRADDVAPNRIGAAQAAARSFVAAQPRNTRIGIVSFAATASVVQTPTLNRDDILAALDRFQLQRGTAVGSGLLVSLKMIFPDMDMDLRSDDPRPRDTADAMRGRSLDQSSKPATTEFRPVPPGSYTSAVIILLTDGQTTTGPDPVKSARMAAERGVRVFTVGVGTTAGQIFGEEGWSMRVRLDEESLKAIASATNAEYFHADNATDLTKIYNTLNSRLVMEKKETEITAFFAAAGALFALLSALLSLLWFNRVL